MEITYLGHSSFLIKDSKGRLLITDPYDETVGYKLYEGMANIATISHHHFDHNSTKQIKGQPIVLDKVGFFNLCDIPITGIPAYHDNVLGAKRGDNIIFVFEMDDFRICHLGDLGHLLSEDYLDKIGSLDVLLIPVGGNFTISGREAAQVCTMLNSKIVIPMHYKTPNVNFPIDGVENFLLHMKNADRINSSTLKLTDMPDGTNNVKILEYVKE